MRPLRVLLVDDHGLVRAGLRSLVESTTQASVVGEADSGEEALALMREYSPDIVVMDLSMAGMNGLEATRRLVQSYPEVRVLILSMYANQEYVLNALEAGATGYLLKRAAGRDLAEAIEQVAGGRRYLSPDLVLPVEQRRTQKQGGDPLHQLTARQREILSLIAQSKTTKEIALMLDVSTKTVEFHRAQLMERLKVFDVPGLVRFAVKVGLVLPET